MLTSTADRETQEGEEHSFITRRILLGKEYQGHRNIMRHLDKVIAKTGIRTGIYSNNNLKKSINYLVFGNQRVPQEKQTNLRVLTGFCEAFFGGRQCICKDSRSLYV